MPPVQDIGRLLLLLCVSSQLQVLEPRESEAVRGLRSGACEGEAGLEVRAALQCVLLLLRRLCAKDQCADHDP